MAYDEDASYLGSSQGTPANYPTGPAQGYARNPDTADQGARPLAVSTRPYQPITVANDPEFQGATVPIGRGATPNTTPAGPGILSRAASAVGGWVNAGAQMEPGGAGYGADSPTGLTVSPKTSSGMGRTGDDRSSGAGYNDTQSVTVPAGGNVKPYMTFPTDPDASLPTAPVQPYGKIVQNANQAMANNYSDRLAAEDARRPNSQEVASAKRDAEVARFRATDGADMVLAGGNKAYAAQRAAIVQNAANATGNAQRLDNLARGASQVTPPNLVQGAIAQTEADQRARSSSFDQQKGSVAVAGGKQGLQKGAQELATGNLQLHTAQHMADLQKRALSGDTKANDILALYQKAQSGKGGPITDEDKLKLYDDMVSRAVAMGGPEAYKSLPDFQTLSAHMDGRAGPPPADWMARARAANPPGTSDEDLAKLYAQKAR